VAVTIVRTSKVGVKVAMVGKGVTVGGAGVSVGGRVAVRVGESVSVGAAVGTVRVAGICVAGLQAVSAKNSRVTVASIRIGFIFSVSFCQLVILRGVLCPEVSPNLCERDPFD